MKTRLLILLSLALTFFAVSIASGQGSARGHNPIADATDLNCRLCHDCDEPRPQDPCLKPCPTHTMTHTTSKHQLDEAPDELLLDKLAEQYRPVRFNHKLHAEMAEMGQDCATCHHFSPPGRIPPCAECHDSETNPTNLRRPSLKGAYHRQCLSCHREWSHDTKCVVCHLPADLESVPADHNDSTDIIGISHPVIHEPDLLVYNTPYEKGPVVTFHHEEHIELFGLTCANCHKQENCSYCHDLERPARFAKTQEEVHAICNDCHREDACSVCHDTKRKPGFSHESTGWALSRYHRDLPCRACHPTGKKIAKLNNDCVDCHAGWAPGNFDHVVTGLRLDETHAEFECEYCHIDLAFDRAPDCSSCHDSDVTPKDTPPGTYIEPIRAQQQ